MFGGVCKAGWAAILAGSVLFGGSFSAQAADLGGDCCADLEERIAELEATTARKGNRKVDLTVYGQVNEAVMFWDDGFEENAYIVTNDASRTRFGFKGDAKIADGWKAKFKIEVGIRTASSKRSNQDDPVGLETNFDLRHAWWAIESKKYGTIHVGHTPTALEEVTESNVAGTGSVGKFTDVEDSGLGMSLVDTAGNYSTVQWRRLIKHTGDPPGEGERRQAVWYVSPKFSGFWVEAGWGGDDFWDVGVRFAEDVGDFEIEAGIAYGQSSMEDSGDNTTFACVAETNDEECSTVGGSVSAMHKPTGLYASFGAGWFKDENILSNAVFAGADNESTFWAVEGGIQKEWFPIGKTTLFGQYYDYQGGANARQDFASNAFSGNPGGISQIFSSDLEMWGLGAMQELKGAGMKLYVLYRHYEADLTLVETAAPANKLDVDLEDLDILMTGAIIKF
jgi:predicted porin